MSKRTLIMTAAALGLGVALFVASALGPSPSSPEPVAVAVGVEDEIAGNAQVLRGASLDELIVSLQTRLEAVPDDHVSWATLGLAYVQQAKVTVDPSFYPRADGVLARSLELDDSDNFLAYAGLSALASARHEFEAAKQFAEQGLLINDFSAVLYGALSDAELQLGNYDAAFAAVQRMVDLSPDTASLSRASYTWELRGDTDRARALMQRALDDSPTPADRAFALGLLGGLAFDQGDAATALDLFNDALVASPDDIAALAGKARTEAALGQVETAIGHWDEVVTRAPEPGYVIEYARLLESLGRRDQAEQQWMVFDATQQLFATNGVQPDATVTLADAERGKVDQAIVDADRGIATRPFLDMHDARAWALHLAGRDAEALVAIDQALQLGTRNARFHFHAGAIAAALGDTERTRVELTTALEINPSFDPLSAPAARDLLASLGADS